MARIVTGVATAHTPLLILPPEQWLDYAARDSGNPELVFPPDGLARSYDEALAHHVSTQIRNQPRDLEHFRRQSERCQQALDACAGTLRDARPDVVLIISDDQDEWFYENNMPMYSVYWGETVPLIPRPRPTAGTQLQIEMDQRVADGYAASRRDVPVDAALGRHVIEYLVEHDFDISHMTYVDASYGGRVVRRTPTLALPAVARWQGLVTQRLRHRSPARGRRRPSLLPSSSSERTSLRTQRQSAPLCSRQCWLVRTTRPFFARG